jgi:hypothetical protein
VQLYWLDAGRELTDAERIRALREYRSTGGMYLVVMARPSGDDSPEECDRLSGEGVGVEQIDWSDFDVAVAS